MSTATPMTKNSAFDTTKAWGWRRPDGSFVIDSSLTSERDAWEIALGWPDEAEIEAAKKAGWIVRRWSV